VVLGYYKTTTAACGLLSEAPAGFGVNVTSNELLKCAGDGCTLCRNDHRYCTACDQSLEKTLVNSKCIDQSQVEQLKVKAKTIETSSSTVTIAFNSKLQEQNYSQLRIQLTGDKDSQQLFESQSLFRLQRSDNLLKISISIQENVLRGTLTISRTTESFKLLSTGDNYFGFDSFPLTVDEVTIFGNAATQRIFTGIGGSVSVVSDSKTAVSAGLVISNPSIAMVLDKLFCDFSYLNLIGAQNTTYTTALFQYLRNSEDVPFVGDNPFEDFAKDDSCELDDILSTNEVDCSFLLNYGSDTVYLLGILCVNLLVWLCNKLFRKKLVRIRKSSKSAFVRAILKGLLSVLSSFDTRYFIMKMDGNILEIIMFSVLHIERMRNNRQMWIGLIAAGIFVVYYFVYNYMLYSYGKKLQSSMSKPSMTDTGSPSQASFRYTTH